MGILCLKHSTPVATWKFHFSFLRAHLWGKPRGDRGGAASVHPDGSWALRLSPYRFPPFSTQREWVVSKPIDFPLTSASDAWMDFDWLDAPFDLKRMTPREIEESFEDPFSIRLLPELPNTEEARYFNLGHAVDGAGLFSVFWTDGKRYRVILARPMTPEEEQFYERKNSEAF